MKICMKYQILFSGKKKTTGKLLSICRLLFTSGQHSGPQKMFMAKKVLAKILPFPDFHRSPSRNFFTVLFNMGQRMTKPIKWHVRQVKTQISLGFRPVWSVFAKCWMGNSGSFMRTAMPRLIWVFAERTCHFVGFVMRWLICEPVHSISYKTAQQLLRSVWSKSSLGTHAIL